MKICKVEGCAKAASVKNTECNMHKSRKRRHGTYEGSALTQKRVRRPDVSDNQLDVVWLAGLLEGEGCFSLNTFSGFRPQARVDLGMCDEDVVRSP